MPEISMIYDVIVSWGDNASRYLVCRLICFVVLVIILFFTLVDSIQEGILLKILACQSLVFQTLQKSFISYIFLRIHQSLSPFVLFFVLSNQILYMYPPLMQGIIKIIPYSLQINDTQASRKPLNNLNCTLMFPSELNELLIFSIIDVYMLFSF